MRKMIAIVWKDLLVRFSSPVELVFFILLPVVFTFILAGGSGAPKDGRVRLVVVDQAQTALSAQLVTALGKSEAVRADVLPLDQAESQFSQRQVVALLIIPSGFDLARLNAGQAALDFRQLPNNINAVVAQRAVQAVISRVGAAASIAANTTAEAEKIRAFATPADRAAFFDEVMNEAQSQMDRAPARLAIDKGTTKDSINYDPRANSSAGQLITWVFVPLVGISGLFAYERQTGTLRRLLTTPTQKAVFLLGTILGQVLVALGQMLLLVGFGVLVLGLNWGRDPLALFVVLLATALAGAALGTTLGTFVKTEGQATGLSIMLSMVMALLGGCWYPMELFPSAIQTAVKVLPTTWAMQGLLDLVMRGQDLAGILPEAGVLLGFAALFFTVGILRFRYE
jgi:ABC-2 type transport system permease protein